MLIGNSLLSHFLMKFIFLFLFLLTTHTALADQDDDFLAARDAFRAGDEVKLNSLAQRLRHSPLEVYIAYYQLRMRLETSDASVVREYLSRTDDTPLVDRMRAEWLRLLGRKQQWELFDSEYPRLLAGDAELSCYALQARLRTQEQAVLREARNLWFTGKDQPESCGTLFDAAIATDIITQQDIRKRLRLALEGGNVSLAKSLAGRTDGGVSAAVLDRANNDPARYLEGLRPPDHAGEGQRIVALFALQRLARQSPDLAVSGWEKVARHFTVSERQYFFGWLAYEAARKHDPRALTWFREAGDASLNEAQAAWRVRAALRVQDWHEVSSAIDAMSPSQRAVPAWLYWKGRALQALGMRAEATRIFVPLSAGNDFYGQMANEELSDTSVLSRVQTNYRPGRQELAGMAKLPGLQRAIILYRMDLRTDALREWSWAIRNFNDHELLAAAEIARRNEMYDRAINTAEKTVTVHDFALRYLAPYRSAMREHIRENGLEEAWVYGLMRQESRFVTSAKSGVGASGLMQVMPTTANWIARKMGWKGYRESMLHQLDTNLKLGTYYMKNMLSSLNDSPVLATAAYNAGPGRAKRWRADTSLEGAIYVETIPFDETRDYVKKVMSNTVYYAREFGAPPRSLKQRLGMVRGKVEVGAVGAPATEGDE